MEGERKQMKSIEVVAAIIKKDNTVLATQRGHGAFKGLWEFPGGKIEVGETKEAALIREIKEELNIEIEINDFFQTVDFDYPQFYVQLHFYFAHIVKGEIVLLDHKDARWLSMEELDSVEWLEADIEIIEKLKKLL